MIRAAFLAMKSVAVQGIAAVRALAALIAEIARACTWVCGAWAAYNAAQFLFQFPTSY